MQIDEICIYVNDFTERQRKNKQFVANIWCEKHYLFINVFSNQVLHVILYKLQLYWLDGRIPADFLSATVAIWLVPPH